MNLSHHSSAGTINQYIHKRMRTTIQQVFHLSSHFNCCVSFFFFRYQHVAHGNFMLRSKIMHHKS